jgi:hypothetical protein
MCRSRWHSKSWIFVSFKHSGSFVCVCVRERERFVSIHKFIQIFLISCLIDVNVHIVESAKRILLQCVVGQLDQKLYVMHAASCGPTRLVILLTSMVLMKCLIQLLYFIWGTTAVYVFSSSGVGCIGQMMFLCYVQQYFFYI